MILCYCKKCGRIVIKSNNKVEFRCDCCNSKVYIVPKRYLDEKLDFMIKNEKSEQLLIEELVKTSPEFDQNLFDHRDEYLAQKHAEYTRDMEIGKAILNGAKPKDAFRGNFNVPKCPSCGSNNISKIGLVSRAISTGLFGLASSKIGKTHKCNNCGSTW